MRRVLALTIICAIALSSCATADRIQPSRLAGYRISYRIEDRPVGGRAHVSHEIVWVRRPFDGRVNTVVGTRVTGGRITTRSFFWQLGPGDAVKFGVLRSPGGPARDASLSAIRDAVAAGAAEEIGTDRVLGRTCAWFAYRDPAPASLRKPTSSSRVESCVDASGIVLREVWTFDGRPARVIEADDVARRTPPAKMFLEGRDPKNVHVTDPGAAALLGTSILVQDVEPGESSPFKLVAPSGWRRARFAVVASTPGRQAQPTQFLSRSFTRGEDLVVVETASSPQLRPPWATDQGAHIKIGDGEGRIVNYTDRVELRLLSGKGYARVVAPSRSLAFLFVRGLA